MDFHSLLYKAIALFKKINPMVEHGVPKPQKLLTSPAVYK